jgi:hypothetical protein
MSATHAPVPGGGGHGEAELSLRDRPIDLVDIGRVLGASAHVERLGEAAPIRAWRDDLTLIEEALSYARAVLTADVAILAKAGSPSPTESESIMDELSSVLAASLREERWVEPDGEGEDLGTPDDPGLDDLGLDDLGLDESLFIRTDHLLAAHQEMARVNLSSPAAAARVRERVEEQLAILTERQAAVEARLQQIRAVIIRRYQIAAAPVRDQPA